MAQKLDKESFENISCLKCANCCKVMTPTFKKAEVKRIAEHVGMTYKQYFDKYLYYDETGDIMNKNTPCQHLGKNNMCSVYEIRPKDCSGFPHTQSKDFKLFIPETHIQNLEFCPATFYVVEKMFEKVTGKSV
jgi:Fe-S-cluster containining protein